MSDEKPMAEVVALPVPGSSAERVEALRSLLSEWWTPPDEMVGQLPGRGGSPPLDYLNHAYVTRALIECDPCWTWEPMSFTADGQPLFGLDKDGNPQSLWIWLTVHGVRRPGFGACERPGTPDAVKSIVSDCIVNAAMRFGVALNLWTGKHKAEQVKKAPRKKEPLPAAVEPNLEHLRAQVDPPADEDPDSEKTAAIDLYNRLCQQYSQEIVNGALATHKVSKYTELTPAKGKVIEASLVARARLIQEEEDRAKQLAKEQADAKRSE